MPFTYEYDNSNQYIMKATGSGEVTFPSNVLNIQPNAFDTCKSSITSIIVPHTITSIGNHFSICPNLKSITFLNNHLRPSTSFGITLLQYCPNLEVIVLPNSFYYNTDITKITNMFYGCLKLKLYTEKEWDEHLEREKHYKLVQDMNVNLKQIQGNVEELKKEKQLEKKEREEKEEREKKIRLEQEQKDKEEQIKRERLEQEQKEKELIKLEPHIILDEIVAKKLFNEIMLFISTSYDNLKVVACWQRFINSLEHKTDINDDLYEDKYDDVLCDLDQELKRVSSLSVDIHKILNQYWIFYEIKMVARRENREKKYLEKEKVRQEKEIADMKLEQELQLEKERLAQLAEERRRKRQVEAEQEDAEQNAAELKLQLFKEEQIKKRQQEEAVEQQRLKDNLERKIVVPSVKDEELMLLKRLDRKANDLKDNVRDLHHQGSDILEVVSASGL